MLALILCLALTAWGWRMLSRADATSAWLSAFGIGGLMLMYLVSYLGVNHLLEPALPQLAPSPLAPIVLVVVGLAFTGLFALHVMMIQPQRPRWLEPLRIHAANGFYADAILHRLFASIAKS